MGIINPFLSSSRFQSSHFPSSFLSGSRALDFLFLPCFASSTFCILSSFRVFECLSFGVFEFWSVWVFEFMRFTVPRRSFSPVFLDEKKGCSFLFDPTSGIKCPVLMFLFLRLSSFVFLRLSSSFFVFLRLFFAFSLSFFVFLSFLSSSFFRLSSSSFF